MSKWSIRDLWGRLTQKKALNSEMRTMLLDLDGVYDPKGPAAGEPPRPPERPQQEQAS